eukprot:scaffold60175_cov106-Attheya_sp.AAC.1
MVGFASLCFSAEHELNRSSEQRGYSRNLPHYHSYYLSIAVYASSTMSNTVWVRWTASSTDAMFYAKVKELDDDADVDDLRNAFVGQQRLDIGPATVSVFENGEKLSEDKKLKDYFVPPAGSAFLRAPGKSKVTALVVTLPPPQQQN